MNAIVLDNNLEVNGDIKLPEKLNEIHSQNLYIYVKSYLAKLRANTAVTKTRADVRGGGKKPWIQKGRGGARAGSIRSPLFTGGGKAHGSGFRNYDQKVNKKQKKLALYCALNKQAERSGLFIVDSISVESGKTKDAMKVVSKINKKTSLIIVNELDDKTYLAFRNIPGVDIIERQDMNAYLLSVYHAIVVEKSVLDYLLENI